MSECESCKKSTQPFAVVPLPCPDPAQVLCESTIDLECVEYTGPSKPCLGISTGMSAAEVLEKLIAATNACKCTLNSSLTFSAFPCETAGIKLEYNDSNFIPQWSYLDKTTNQYVNINTSLLVLSSNSENFIQLLPISLSVVMSDTYKVTLTKPNCAPIVKTITISSDCLPEQICTNINDAIVKHPLTGEPLYYHLSKFDLTPESASKLLCDTFPNLTKEECRSYNGLPGQDWIETYYYKFKSAYDNYTSWQYDNIIAIIKDNPVEIAETNPVQLPPKPHVSDFVNYGKERAIDPNYNWIDIPVMHCPCGLNTTDIKIYVKYLPHVSTFSQLPASAQLGNVCYVEIEDKYYTFNPETNEWVDPLLFTTYFGKKFLAATDVNTGAEIDSFDNCILSYFARIDARKKSLYELLSAKPPFIWSQLFIMHRVYDIAVRDISFGAPLGPAPGGNPLCDCECCYE